MSLNLSNVGDKNQVHWFVMRAYKREKEAEEILSGEDGLEFYIAKKYVVQTYHGKKKKRLVPCIPGLIFVHASHNQIVKFKEVYNLLQFVMWKKSTGTETIIVPDTQMDNFIRVTSNNEDQVTYYSPEEINIEKGTHIRVHGGQLDGVEGVFVKVQGKRSKQVVVLIPDVMAASVEVKPDLIEVIG